MTTNGKNNALESAPQAMIDEIDNLVRQVNAAVPPPRPPREVYDFEKLGSTLAEGILEMAQQTLTLSQNELERAKSDVDQLTNIIAKRAERMADINRRLKDLGEARLEAHKRFHEGLDD